MKPERVQSKIQLPTESMKPERVQEALKSLPDWQILPDVFSLRRTFSFPTLRAANLFVSLVMEVGDDADFVPEIAVSYVDVTLTVQSPDASLGDREMKRAKLFSLVP